MNKKILVIGDSCDDVYIYGECKRLCPEAPVPVFNPVKDVYSDGMSLNVFNNLDALGIEVDLITNDIKPKKTRFVDIKSNQMFLRVDINDKIKNIDNVILNSIKWDDYFAVVISDYNKGFLQIENIKFISSKHNNVFLDTKKSIGDWCNNIKFVKINDIEYKNNLRYFNDNMFNGNLIVTKGEHGCVIMDSDFSFPIELENKIDVLDVSGAGDTFLAGLVAKYSETNDIVESARYGNLCASWVVSHKGITVVNKEKIDKI